MLEHLEKKRITSDEALLSDAQKWLHKKAQKWLYKESRGEIQLR